MNVNVFRVLLTSFYVTAIICDDTCSANLSSQLCTTRHRRIHWLKACIRDESGHFQNILSYLLTQNTHEWELTNPGSYLLK